MSICLVFVFLCLISLSKYSLGPFMLLQMAIFHSFLRLNDSPVCVRLCVLMCECDCVCVYNVFLSGLLMGIWVASMSWLWCIVVP